MREHIMTQLDMFDITIDTNRNLLSNILYTIKSLRNSVAHNNIVFDTRFKDRKISSVLKNGLKRDMHSKYNFIFFN